MKQLILILFIATAALSVKAQALQQPTRPKPVMILLPDSSNLVQLQQVLQFSYQWLPQSAAPAGVVGQKGTIQVPSTGIVGAIEQLFPLLVPIKKDSTIKIKPPIVANKK